MHAFPAGCSLHAAEGGCMRKGHVKHANPCVCVTAPHRMLAGTAGQCAAIMARPMARCVKPTRTAWPWTMPGRATLWAPCPSTAASLAATLFFARPCLAEGVSPSRHQVSGGGAHNHTQPWAAHRSTAGGPNQDGRGQILSAPQS